MAGLMIAMESASQDHLHRLISCLNQCASLISSSMMAINENNHLSNPSDTAIQTNETLMYLTLTHHKKMHKVAGTTPEFPSAQGRLCEGFLAYREKNSDGPLSQCSQPTLRNEWARRQDCNQPPVRYTSMSSLPSSPPLIFIDPLDNEWWFSPVPLSLPLFIIISRVQNFLTVAAENREDSRTP